MTTANLFIATGKPDILLKARLIQLGVLIVALLSLGHTLGITGVAIAADLMLLVGIVLMLFKARQWVDISIRKLFQAPLLGLIFGSASTWGVLVIFPAADGDWVTGSIKIMAFSLVYVLSLLILEPKEVMKAFYLIKDYFPLKGLIRNARI